QDAAGERPMVTLLHSTTRAVAVMRPCRRSGATHLEGRRLEDDRGGERQRQQRDLGPEQGDRLARPQLQELRVPPQAVAGPDHPGDGAIGLLTRRRAWASQRAASRLAERWSLNLASQTRSRPGLALCQALRLVRSRRQCACESSPRGARLQPTVAKTGERTRSGVRWGGR